MLKQFLLQHYYDFFAKYLRKSRTKISVVAFVKPVQNGCSTNHNRVARLVISRSFLNFLRKRCFVGGVQCEKNFCLEPEVNFRDEDNFR